MERVVRAVPVSSREALQEFAQQIAKRPQEERQRFLEHFGGAVEEWYYQEIDGKPHVIAVVEGEQLSAGFAKYPSLQDPFFDWFREGVLELTGVDLREVPKAAPSEFIFRLSA